MTLDSDGETASVAQKIRSRLDAFDDHSTCSQRAG
jgi:hypothetical protein